FQQRTGAPVHRYLTRLRLRASLERLADGETDLTALALELGFSSHSHFTGAFRREFGRTPSAVRRDPVRRTIRESGKSLAGCFSPPDYHLNVRNARGALAARGDT